MVDGDVQRRIQAKWMQHTRIAFTLGLRRILWSDNP